MSERIVPPRYTVHERCKALFKLAYLLRESPNYRLGVSSDRIVMLDVDCSKSRICWIWGLWIAEWLSKALNCDVVVFRTENGYHIVALKELESREEEITRLTGELRRLQIEKERLEKEIDRLIREWRYLRDRGRYREAREVREKIVHPKYGLRWRLLRVIGEIKKLQRELEYLTEYRVREPYALRYWEQVYEILRDTFRRGKPYWYWEYAVLKCLDRLHVEITLKRHYTTLRISGKPSKPYDIYPRYLYRNGVRVWSLR